MKPLYAARIEDLSPSDFVKVGCIACRQDMLIPAIGLLNGLRLPALHLGARFRKQVPLSRMRCAR
jgi:hypothetical protein